MNDLTHDDTGFILDRAITYYRGWSIERRPAGTHVIKDPDDLACRIAFSVAEAREWIDAAIARGEFSA